MAIKINRKSLRKNRTRKRMRGGTNTSENMCIYVSSRGILKSCYVHNSNPTSSTTTLDGIDLSKIKENSTVYITGSAVSEFAKHLDEIQNKFILVSGDCDETIPADIFSDDEFNKFINSEKIIHWYSQNCTKTHPKLSIIPIGLDYHSTGDRDKNMSPVQEEQMLNDIIKLSKPFYEREKKCYSNFYLNKDKPYKYYYNRRNAVDKVPKELVTYEMERVTKNISFTNQIKYAFVISPHGNGLDCHRTWEALCLGCIPIVKKSPIDRLYTDLPVLIINNWSDLSQDLLNNTISDFKDRKFNYEKLKLKYWMDKIKTGNPIV